MLSWGVVPFSRPGTIAWRLINEPPLIASWDKTVLAEDIVAGIELGPVESEGMFLWEQMVQAADGCEVFTTEPSTLFIVDCCVSHRGREIRRL
jgi:hypothetical protein